MSLDFVITTLKKNNVINESIKSKLGGLTEVDLQNLEVLIQERVQDILKSHLPQKNKKSIKLPFGKYKGHALSEIYQSDPDYLNWLKNKCEWISKFNDLNAELQSFTL